LLPLAKLFSTMVRNAKAVWNGSGKEGKGQLTTQSKTLNNTSYNYVDRFENGTGTNPEELIAAAHSGCFSMKLSFVLGAAGFTPEAINTSCNVTLENGAITKSELTVQATVPGISADKFMECANEAKTNCPVSKLLNCEITMDASLG
jgi:osmotically inducible protein OsmC